MPDATMVRGARMVPLKDLLPAEWNANRVPAKTLEKVRRSIEEFGFVENLVARPHPTSDGKLEVLSGNHRLGLLAELGVAKAPVVVVELGDADARILAQALNRTRGSDDPEAYARLLEDVLAESGRDRILEFLPETDSSIDRVLAAFAGPSDVDPDEAPPLPTEPRSKLGEVYELGPHLLMCGDATDPEQVRELFSPPRHHGLDLVDCVWTDPPYGVKYVGKTAAQLTIRNDDAEGLQALLVDAFHAVGAGLHHNARFYVSSAPGPVHHRFLDAFDAAGWRLHQTLVWVKHRMVLGHSDYHYRHEFVFYGWVPRHEPGETKGRAGRGNHPGTRWYGGNDQTSVFEIDAPARSAEHPTIKPVELVERCLLNSTERGTIVYDPFGGSGTTLVACDRLGRRARLMELDPGYCDVIRARYEALVGG